MKNSKEDFNRGLRGLTRINTLFYPCHPRNPWSIPLGCGEVALGVLRPSACCWSGPAGLRLGYACEVVGAYHCRQTDPARKSVRRLRFRLVGYACGVVCSRYRWPACRASGNEGQKGAWNSGASEGMGAWCSGAAAAAACCLHGKQLLSRQPHAGCYGQFITPIVHRVRAVPAHPVPAHIMNLR